MSFHVHRPWAKNEMDEDGKGTMNLIMLLIHEITCLLVQIKALMIPNACMLSYFKYISIILYHFML